jgi:DNA gyrase subunit A
LFASATHGAIVPLFYCVQCKLAPLTAAALLADIELDTVDFVSNFDGNEVEPVILPARLPMLLLNGATGIAVGMATNVPPHNLGELVDGLSLMLRTRLSALDAAEKGGPSEEGGGGWGGVTDDDLFRLIPGPDFPTGGLILGREGARKLYATGHGSVTVRAKTNVETIETRTPSGRASPRTAIVVTEVPYQCNKAALLERMAALVNDKKLSGISDLRDESDR